MSETVVGGALALSGVLLKGLLDLLTNRQHRKYEAEKERRLFYTRKIEQEYAALFDFLGWLINAISYKSPEDISQRFQSTFSDPVYQRALILVSNPEVLDKLDDAAARLGDYVRNPSKGRGALILAVKAATETARQAYERDIDAAFNR